MKEWPFALVLVSVALGASAFDKTGVSGATPATRDPLFAGSKTVVPRNQVIGTYYFGDGLGVNCSLDLKPDNTFKFSWHGCMGEYDKNAGTWFQNGDMVTLQPSAENKHEGFEGVNVRFVPIIWNHQLFLVDEYEAPGFCASLSDDIKDIHGLDYVKRGSNKPSKVAIPNTIPARFAMFLKAKPVKARVSKLLKNGDVEIDRGSKDRLRPGLMLAPNSWSTGDLEVISVSERAAVCRPGYFFNKDKPIKVGTEFSTGAEYNRPHGTGWVRLAKPPK